MGRQSISLVEVAVNAMKRRYPSIPPEVFYEFAARIAVAAREAACVDDLVAVMPGVCALTNYRNIGTGKLEVKATTDTAVLLQAQCVKPLPKNTRKNIQRNKLT
jgi:hypothetical protein